MCGIAGFISQDVSSIHDSVGRQMRSAILYRGRDAAGAWSDRHAHLFHSRLSIIDRETGSQPMVDASGQLVIVFNGEIYNFIELRKEYERLGARFRTESDTEVILQGYRLKGASVCNDLNGMFAFAIWDTAKHQLFLARDRLGKKPLFWTVVGDAFFFSSTLDAFHGIPGWNPKLSESALALYGGLGSFPLDTTIYENARSLLPATWALVRPGDTRIKPEPYWKMAFRGKSQNSLNALVEEYEDILTDAVRIRLRSDVPLALTFSGGVDSGSIAAICAQRLNTPLTCYTIDYHTQEDPSEETIIAKRAAEYLGLHWEYIHFDYHQELLADLGNAYTHYDQPCQQLPLVYISRLYQAIKPFATVVLSGNGADELFTGYIGDERSRRKELVLRTVRWLQPLLRNIPSVSPYLRMPLPSAIMERIASRIPTDISGEVHNEARSVLRSMAMNALEAGAESVLDFQMFHSLTCLTVDSNFTMPDILGLAAQVEVRSPFLDYRMVEFATRIPDRYKVGSLFSARLNKYIPKTSYAKLMEPDIAWSRKKGMAWNVRWDKSIGSDEAFKRAFTESYNAIDQYGLSSLHYRNAWNAYVAEIAAGVEFSGHAQTMLNGFMLGKWLSRDKKLVSDMQGG
jgi:asparagine synthase (glutamine-hydrolysing)